MYIHVRLANSSQFTPSLAFEVQTCDNLINVFSKKAKLKRILKNNVNLSKVCKEFCINEAWW